MGFRKFQADALFTGHEMLTGQVLLTDEAGQVETVLPVDQAGEDVLFLEGILSPGFINCHCHLELSHLKGRIKEKTGLIDFVSSIMAYRHLPEDEIVAAISTAEEEMLHNGIVAVGDICNTAFTLGQKSKNQLRYHNFVEVSGFNPSLAEQRFDQALSIFSSFQENLGASTSSIVPHAPYSVSEPLWQKILDFPANQLMTIHNQEVEAENEWFRSKTGGFSHLYRSMALDTSFFKASGKSSLQTFLPRLPARQPWLLVHDVATSQEDLEFAHRQSPAKTLYWCLCPNANLYISDLLPPVQALIDQGVTIVLGTDSLASNHQLSILAEIKTILQRFPHVPATELLKWATYNGASALQLEHTLGSFEKGKKPGVLLLDKTFEKLRRLV